MIKSIHISKCAGTSFRKFLKQNFVVYDDYLSPPDQKGVRRKYPDDIGEDVQVIHGHFQATKYARRYPDADHITWLRDPWKRANSHYKYRITTQKAFDDSKYPPKDPEGFIKFPPQVNFMSQFINKKPLDEFKFIGIVEKYNEDMKRFCKIYDLKPNYRHINKAAPVEGLPKELKDDFIKLNEDDYKLYEEALSLR
jgi:hypothetical protein